MIHQEGLVPQMREGRRCQMIHQFLDPHLRGERNMMILSHIHGPQAWRRSGYWKIAQSLGRWVLEGRSMMMYSSMLQMLYSDWQRWYSVIAWWI
jgi:hypothetical protein